MEPDEQKKSEWTLTLPPLPNTPVFGTEKFEGPDAAELREREFKSYAYSRQIFHDILDRIKDANVDGPVAAEELRAYAMRQLIALTGNPDPKVALQAVKLLGQVKNIAIFEEKSAARSSAALSDAELQARVREAMRKVQK